MEKKEFNKGIFVVLGLVIVAVVAIAKIVTGKDK